MSVFESVQKTAFYSTGLQTLCACVRSSAADMSLRKMKQRFHKKKVDVKSDHSKPKSHTKSLQRPALKDHNSIVCM